jgi:hypothetical protein
MSVPGLPTAIRAGARHAYIAILAAYPVLHVAVENSDQVPVSTPLIAMLVSALAACALMVLLRAVSGSWDRAGAGVVLVALLFYTYGPVHTSLETYFLAQLERQTVPPENLTLRLHLWLSLAWAALCIAGLWFTIRSGKQFWDRLAPPLNVVAITLLAFQLVRLATGATGFGEQRAPAPTVAGKRETSLGYNPDIYYIILDGYARDDILRHYYGFDNRGFLDGLRERGFAVNTASSANYFWTFLSLSSALNMQYVQELYPQETLRAEGRRVLYEAIRDSSVARFLRERGYTYVHFQSTWGATLYNPHADQQVRCRGGLFQQEFYRVLAEVSWLKALQAWASNDLARCHLSNFDSLARMGDRPGPKFVFAHFLLPHHPYLFDREGRVLRDANLSNQFAFQEHLWEKRPLYVAQLEYVNQRVLQAIDAVLERSAHPPIVVLQSDHGPALREGIARTEQLRIRLANFAAYRLPGAPPCLMPADGSPVNQFRRILGFYFDADLPPLEQRYFYSSYRDPYAFRPVKGMERSDATPVCEDSQ